MKNTHNHAELVNVKLESTELLEITSLCLFLLINVKKMILLKSLNIPLSFLIMKFYLCIVFSLKKSSASHSDFGFRNVNSGKIEVKLNTMYYILF